MHMFLNAERHRVNLSSVADNCPAHVIAPCRREKLFLAKEGAAFQDCQSDSRQAALLATCLLQLLAMSCCRPS